VDRGLIRNALIVSACVGALGTLTKPAIAEADIHSYIKSFRRDVLVNLADEATECVAYFEIAAKTMRDAKEPNGAAQADAASKRSLDWALQLTKWAGLKEETVWANLKFATKYMLARIETDNIDLVEDYGHLCRETKGPSPVLGWLARASREVVVQ
jgi:hypothetical protein